MMRSLFAKTWLISVMTIFLTTGLLFVIVSLFADSLIYKTQKSNFDERSTEILTLIKDDKVKALDKYIAQGYTIQLDDITLLSGADVLEKSGDAAELGASISIQSNTRLIVDKKKNFQKTKELKKDDKTITVSILYPIALNQNEIFDLIRNIAPYFLLITFAVSSVIAVGYARYFSNKIKRMNRVVDQMALENYPTNILPSSGDELQELTNNIHAMYDKLRRTMTALHEEINLVSNLEDSRRLFMSGIVHELNTPIMNMRLASKGAFLKEENEEKRAFLRNQLDYLTGMSKLVSELLELSRVDEKTVRENNPVETVLKDVVSVYSEMVEDKQQVIQLNVSANQTMRIPKNKMQKLFSNLLGNAIKYAPEKSTILIDVTEEQLLIENQVLTTEDTLSIEELHKPFVTTDQESDYSSHGLGLYLIQSILQFYNYRYLCTKKDKKFRYQIFFT